MYTLREGVALCDYTTLKVGGKAQYFIAVTSGEELKTAALFAEQKALPFFVLGGGSNVLISDSGVKGVVVHMGILGWTERLDGDEVLLEVGAGVMFDELVAATVKKGYWGLENLSHIPGTVGATPIQNVGAYGVEVSDCIVEVKAFHFPSRTTRTFTTVDCDFSYRSSFFKTTVGKEYVVTSVTFALSKEPRPRVSYADLAKRYSDSIPNHPQDIRDSVISIRSSKFPDWHSTGTAGSFFKNPIIPRTQAEALREHYPDLPLYDVDALRVKCSLGYILDKVCGLRGYGEGTVRLYEKQALVLVAESGATAYEIEQFSDMIIKKVFSATGIQIEREVTFVSENIF
jgi:UDP-N-acetylmuramate dehydrogenase